MSTGPAVAAEGVVKRFGQGDAEVRALDDVSVSVARGEFFTLLGPSGCGKTTLLRCIAGFETPTGGCILLGGRDITHEPPNRRRVNTVIVEWKRSITQYSFTFMPRYSSRLVT